MNNKDFNENAIGNIDDIRILPNQQEYSTYAEMKEKQSELMQIAKNKVKQMTESFDLEMFYNSPKDMIALIVITQYQVVTVYGDEKILHDEIIPIIKELLLNKDNNSRIIIRCAKTKKIEFFIPQKRGQISKQMSQLMTIFYNKLNRINKEKSHKTHKIKIAKLKFSNLLDITIEIMKKNNKKQDKEIVGIMLGEYIKKSQKEQDDIIEL